MHSGMPDARVDGICLDDTPVSPNHRGDSTADKRRQGIEMGHVMELAGQLKHLPTIYRLSSLHLKQDRTLIWCGWLECLGNVYGHNNEDFE